MRTSPPAGTASSALSVRLSTTCFISPSTARTTGSQSIFSAGLPSVSRPCAYDQPPILVRPQPADDRRDFGSHLGQRDDAPGFLASGADFGRAGQRQQLGGDLLAAERLVADDPQVSLQLVYPRRPRRRRQQAQSEYSA